MRPTLLHPLREPRHSRRRRRARGAGASAERVRAVAVETVPEETAPEPTRPEPTASRSDPDVERVREAGGPVDRASYACACGYLFSADVSTTVVCPHCGADQSW